MAIIPIGLEGLVWFLIILTVIKLVTISIKPEAWSNLGKGIFSNSIVSSIVFLILAFLSLDILRDAGITYVQILAVTVFLMFIIGLSFAPFGKEYGKLADKLLKKQNILKKAWLPILVWALLFILALTEMF